MWVACAHCIGCPTSSLILLQFFDPSNSSTISAISCADQRCAQYSGRFFKRSDAPRKVHGNTTFFNSSAHVIFGCSTHYAGGLTKSINTLDGIIGLGQRGLSIISQLSAQGLAPYVFSHCLEGSGHGGGILVLGPILEPRLVYTPLVPSKLHYNVNLESISVNGKPLPIRQSVFSMSNNQGGTIIDSGTTGAYLPHEAYQPLVDKVTQMVSPPARAFVSDGYTCYEVASRISETFPSVQLNFDGRAAMLLKPEHYLLSMGFGVSSELLFDNLIK
ncbi:aspartic protease [Lithospermum erythrorhizon]|uniref:Aspartic protease n=1 Tax=Lithospermum erythrorhizon TaxID=34254 RepID=A0AAV3QFJ1_LITER